ncbi:hypothetical protein JVT61DRAFT_4195 [Boletus reticuloceps]|uniref:Aip3p/Bud6 N-terminal domain-containing protein n=1 Tax=Boletus reticuloceps TaxID=495285 RepID=A0A8I3A9H1_9AGAM|nr:hypothetical protein JVT61DRAFT_4195 [Boletus reticuloceps]
MSPAGSGSSSPAYYAELPMIVHDLIQDMKALESALHRWSRGTSNLQRRHYDIPTRYVITLLACRTGDGPIISDLHAIPTQLRSALEECLGETPSLNVLDRYLPEIRRLLGDVLHGLRAKQPAWRNATTAASVRAFSPGGPRLPPTPFP